MPRMTVAAKGIWRYYCSLPGISDSVIIVLLQKAGIQADSLLEDYTDLASLKAANAEATFTNYARPVFSVTGPTGLNIVPNNITGLVTLDHPDVTISAAGSPLTPQELWRAMYCYRPADTAADTACIPLFLEEFEAVTNGSDLVIRPHVDGLAESA